MKKIILTSIFVALTICAFGQQKIMKFLGIPIDGHKSEMIESLKAKGFKYNAQKDYFTGEFNGYDVEIYIATNNNKVYRIYVADANTTDEASIKIRYNNLYNQFKNNGKYLCVSGEELTDKDDISYEMTVHNKRYDVSFMPIDMEVNGCVWYTISSYYGKYYISMYYDNLNNKAKGEDL